MTTKFNSRAQKKASCMINLDTYTRDNRLIISKADGDKTFIGRVYEMSPLIGGGSEFANVLNNLFKTAPDDSLIQVSLICEPDYQAGNVFSRNKDQGGDVVTELISQQAEVFKNATNVGWQDNMPLLNIRTVVISCGLPVKAVNTDTLEDAAQLQTEFLSNIRSSGFYDARALTVEELVETYKQFANPFNLKKPVQLDEVFVDLKEQIYGPEDVFDFSFTKSKVGIMPDGVFCDVVSCKAYPEHPTHGLMNLVSGAPFNNGSAIEGGGERISTPFIITTTIRVANQRKESDRVENAIKSRETNQKLPFSLGSEDPATKLRDLIVLKKQAAIDGNKYVYVSTNIFLFGKTQEDAINAAFSVKGKLNKLRFDARNVIDTGLVRWAQSLPLNFSPKISNALECECVMTATAAATLLPVYGDYLGNVKRTAACVGAAFVTRRGNLHLFDPFVSNASYNGLIAAETGAGKSFVLQYLIKCKLAEGASVWLFDNGRSAKKFCVAAEGEYNEFGSDENFNPCLNPFTGLTDDEFNEQAEGITSLLIMMAYDNEQPQSGSQIAVNEAVKAAWGQKGNNADINTVIEVLEATQRAGAENSMKNEIVLSAMNLVPRLKAFIYSPSRGKYFAGPGTLDASKKFTCFELSGLGDDAHLKKCVLFFLLNLLMTRIRTIEGQKLIYVDEALDFVKDPAAADVLEGIYLKGRKDKIATWIVVQSLKRLSELPAGKLIISSSPFKLILAQDKGEIDKMIDERFFSEFANDSYFTKTIKSVETVKQVFSEMMIINQKTYEVVRLYVSKFTSNLFSSEGAARDLVFEYMEQGMNPIDAVYRVIGDSKRKRLGWIKDVIDQLKRIDNLSISDIRKEIDEVLR